METPPLELSAQEQVALLAAARAVVSLDTEPVTYKRLSRWLAVPMGGQTLEHATLLELSALATTRDASQTHSPLWMQAQAARMAAVLEMDPAEARILELAALLHDLGKLTLPTTVLLKPTALDGGERRLVERHSKVGARLLDIPGSTVLSAVSRMVASHHERWDGRGYPAGLQGQHIPLSARILHVLDVYAALVSRRPHREAWQVADALDYVRGQAEWQFDPRVVEVFLAIHTPIPA